MTRRSYWAWGRSMGCGLSIVVLVWRLGTTPFLDGIRTVNGPALAAAAGLGVLSTICCAWRWKIVAGGLGVDLPLPTAVAAYYRSLFLNLTLPGGIVGDVHRGVSHGRDVRDVSRGVRSVAWERFAGQGVQALLTVAILLALPSPVQEFMPMLLIALVVVLIGVVLVGRTRPDGGKTVWTRLRSTAAGDIREGLLARRAWLGVAVASGLVVAGHAATFILAAITAGISASFSRMLPIALIVLLAGVLPSVGGWGPREGVTAWVFGAAGLHAQRGVTTAVVYGVMVLVAGLPGAGFLVMAWFRGTRLPGRAKAVLREEPVHA